MSRYSLFSGLSIVILMVLEMGCGSGPRFLLVRAHAHNDYEQARPLLIGHEKNNVGRIF